MRIARLVTLLMLVLTASSVNSQRVALRNNLLYDATLTPNLGLEVRTDSTWSLVANVGVNAWDIDTKENKKWRHVLVSAGVRNYFGHRRDSVSLRGDHYYRRDSVSLRGVHYWGPNLLYSHFNVGNTRIPFGLYSAVKDRRLQGDLVALGAKYGYSWILARDWRIEAEAGVAVGYAWFKEYDCATCGTYYGRGDRIFLLPQLGVNIVYIIN